MVDFMKNGARKKIGGAEADFLSVFESGFNASFSGTGDFTIDGGYGEAAFVIIEGFSVGFDNFGVNKGNKVGVFFLRHIFADDDDAFVVAELGGGEGGGKLKFVFIFPGKRGVDHIFDNVVDFIIEDVDLGGFLTKPWVGGGEDSRNSAF